MLRQRRRLHGDVQPAAAARTAAEAFERLQKNVDEMKTVALQSEFEEWKQQYEADFQAKSERERKLTAARKAIEGMLDVRCPRCRMVFDEFTGCAALTCAYKGCKCNFCALCLKDTGGDAHAHVKTCKLNPRRGEYFVSTEEWEAIMRERRRAEVRAYWVEMVDPSLRDELRDDPTANRPGHLGLDAAVRTARHRRRHPRLATLLEMFDEARGAAALRSKGDVQRALERLFNPSWKPPRPPAAGRAATAPRPQPRLQRQPRDNPYAQPRPAPAAGRRVAPGDGCRRRRRHATQPAPVDAPRRREEVVARGGEAAARPAMAAEPEPRRPPPPRHHLARMARGRPGQGARGGGPGGPRGGDCAR